MLKKKKARGKDLLDHDIHLKVEAFQHHLNIRFNDPVLLFRALCHTSFVHEQVQLGKGTGLHSNERLEFLGDSILGFVIVEELFSRFPDMAEGSLAKIKAVVASEVILSKSAQAIDLGQYLFLGKGEQNSGGAKRDSTLADAFEALCGALYLDLGMKKVQEFLKTNLFPFIHQVVEEKMWVDHKTQLQEMTQYLFKELPEYTLLEVTGPPHQPIFVVQVSICMKEYARAKGKSKKEAEQSAAMVAGRKILLEHPEVESII